MLNRRRSFDVVIAGGSGRFVRLHVGPGALYGGLALLVLAAGAAGAAGRDYLGLARQRHQVAALHSELSERRRLLDLDDRRFAEIETEIASWNELQRRLWRPLGDAPAARVESGDATPSGRLLANVQDAGLKLRALERLVARSARVLAAVPAGRPVRAAVNSGFGRRPSPFGGAEEFHRGVDLGVGPGTPVKATAPGVVTFAGSTPDYGNTIVVDHGDNLKTRFGHLQKIQIKSGDHVERGQQIALSGNTGQSTGPHLHYELIVRGRPIDPKLSFDE